MFVCPLHLFSMILIHRTKGNIKYALVFRVYSTESKMEKMLLVKLSKKKWWTKWCVLNHLARISYIDIWWRIWIFKINYVVVVDVPITPLKIIFLVCCAVIELNYSVIYKINWSNNVEQERKKACLLIHPVHWTSINSFMMPPYARNVQKKYLFSLSEYRIV